MLNVSSSRSSRSPFESLPDSNPSGNWISHSMNGIVSSTTRYMSMSLSSFWTKFTAMSCRLFPSLNRRYWKYSVSPSLVVMRPLFRPGSSYSLTVSTTSPMGSRSSSWSLPVSSLYPSLFSSVLPDTPGTSTSLVEEACRLAAMSIEPTTSAVAARSPTTIVPSNTPSEINWAG